MKIFNLIKYALYVLWLKNTRFRKYAGIDTRVFLAQMAHETGNFTSKIYHENKNLFGMKESKATPDGFIEIGTLNGHAQYKNYYDSVLDYFVRQKTFKIDGSSDEAYIQSTFNSNYAEDKDYIQRWKTHLATLQNSWEGSAYKIALVVLIIGIIWILSKNFGRR